VVASYAYVNARVGGMRSLLMEEAQYKALVESASLEEAINFLKTTVYGKELGKLASLSLYDIELALSKSVVEDYEKIVRSLRGDAKVFAEEYAKKCELSTIKSLLILKLTGEKAFTLIPYKGLSETMIEKLLETENVEELVENLRFSEFYPVLKEVLSKFDGKIYILTSAMDKLYYKKLYQAMKELKNKDRIVEKLIGSEVDFKNLLLVLRLRGLSKEEVWSYLIPYKYKLKDDELRIFFNTTSVEEIISQMPTNPYSEIIINGVKEYEKTFSFLPLEKEFNKHIISLNKKCFYGDRFHLGVPIAYLNLKENEVRNIVAILRGKEVNLPPSEIMESLIL